MLDTPSCLGGNSHPFWEIQLRSHPHANRKGCEQNEPAPKVRGKIWGSIPTHLKSKYLTLPVIQAPWIGDNTELRESTFDVCRDDIVLDFL